MKALLAIVVMFSVIGCSSMSSTPEPIPANRLYWPQTVDRVHTPSGSVYIIKGK